MRALTLIAVYSLSLSGLAAAQEKEVIQIPGSLEGLPFSTAVRVGDLLFLSGQVGVLPDGGGLVPGGIEPETRQTLENIKQALEYSGSSLDHVVKCTVFLLDIADYAAMNAVYASFFPEKPPARSTLAASGLALNARVEIECIAISGA